MVLLRSWTCISGDCPTGIQLQDSCRQPCMSVFAALECQDTVPASMHGGGKLKGK